MEQTCDAISVSRTIDAPATTLFEILVHSANHPLIDGSGMVRAAREDVLLSSVGDVFTMAMHNDEMGNYEMENHVVEYEPDRHIVWEPVLAAASRPQDVAEIGDRAHHQWGFELTPTGPGRTVVTETFDCSRSPEWLRTAVKGGEVWRESMNASLEKLEVLALGA
jgi:uncharacterized protein YndB with AHSA1/START domain